MNTAPITVDADFSISQIDRRLFGSFVEHMGRCVYTGIFEPGHPTADSRGSRGDVLELVRELGPSIYLTDVGLGAHVIDLTEGEK